MILERTGIIKAKGIFLMTMFLVMGLACSQMVHAQTKPKPKTTVSKTTKTPQKPVAKSDSTKKNITDSTSVELSYSVDSATNAIVKATSTKGSSTSSNKKGTTKATDPKAKTAAGKTTAKPKAPAVAKVSPTLIKPTAMGVLRLGMSIDTIKRMYPKDRVYKVFVYDAKGRYEQYQVMATDNNSQFLLINPDCDGDSICVIRQIVAKSPYFKTKRDITVGMLLDDLVLAYGYLESRWEEENLIVRNPEGIDFIMDTSGIPKRWYRKMNLDRLPLATPIIGIMISSKAAPTKW